MKDPVNRYKALMQETWWAWVIILAFGIFGGILFHWILYSAIPFAIFAFFYFGIMRYDDDGNIKEM